MLYHNINILNNWKIKYRLNYMKKAFVILTLLVAFNFATPNINVLSQLTRHTIEFRQEDRSREVTNNELLKNKVVRYLRMQMLLSSVVRVDKNAGFNTS